MSAEEEDDEDDPADAARFHPTESERIYPCAGRWFTRNGAREWPTTFFACDIIDGFEKIQERRDAPGERVHVKDAFEAVFRLPFRKATFNKHNRIYLDNQDLIPKFKTLGRSVNGTWSEFVRRAKVRDDAKEALR